MRAGRPLSRRERETLERLERLIFPNPKQVERREELAKRRELYGDECSPVLRDILRF